MVNIIELSCVSLKADCGSNNVVRCNRLKIKYYNTQAETVIMSKLT